eukprot:9691396-Alexandrium_andersonii.AAC.1
MSASLVGSEMCIRDRTIALSNWVLAAGSHFATSLCRAVVFCLVNGWFDVCLLYTSDAADDM